MRSLDREQRHVPPTLDALQIICGEAAPLEARVYARVARALDWPTDCRLEGAITGPWSAYARTLTASIRFLDRGKQQHHGGELLAEAIVPDPCFWTHETPFLYNARVELRSAGELLCLVERQFGIRRLGTRGKHLVLDGKAWVPRIVAWERTSDQDVVKYYEAAAVAEVARPIDDFCYEASRVGAPLVAHANGTALEVAAELRRLARYPAVLAAIVDSVERIGESLRQEAPNLLLAQRVAADDLRPAHEGREIAAWANVVVVEAKDADAIAARAATIERPVLARRPCAATATLAEARAACDHLQRELANRGDFAGYMV